jgi:ubiquinone/menaquinone biosynthesis C-methylase UbiE
VASFSLEADRACGSPTLSKPARLFVSTSLSLARPRSLAQERSAPDVQSATRLVQATYDRIAERYDDRWSRHVRQPQERLTRGLHLSRGERCADLGCGTGVETLEMAKRVLPGEVVGVDCSEEMLRGAAARAAAERLPLATVCMEAEAFIHLAESASFDVITLRFCLAYLNWRVALPSVARVLRPGGRVGILTNLSSSTPQAYATYCRLADELGLSKVELPVPDTRGEIADLLRGSGLRMVEEWSHAFRLWFDSGAAVAGWLQESGFVTHAVLREFAPAALEALVGLFARGIEAYREARGIPLDFELCGVVAARP